ncbi:MAG: DUF2975 domain-containing protein [Oscillospiraceae bacterium]|nr:DUF2975 domain-containing protein [Oscillospiraceae bacterium]
MWSKSSSMKLSAILVKLMFVVLVFMTFLIPSLARWYDSTSTRQAVFVPLCITLYFSLIPAFILLLRLDELLKNIRGGAVFIARNCEILRVMSYCCFAVTALYFGFGFIRVFSFLISFAACFIGLILRILKNVFVQAVAIREENDFMI